MKFSVLDWNIQGTKYYTKTSFEKVAPVLKKSKADIFCIQEGQELITQIKNMDELRGFNHVFSRENKDGANVILCRFPVIKSGEFNPNIFTDKPLGKILWADVEIGNNPLRIYNCHFEVDGIGPKERLELLKFIISNSKSYKGGVIICGDLNTTIPKKGLARIIVQLVHNESTRSLFINNKDIEKDERYIFLEEAKKEGFHDALKISQATWRIDKINWQIFKLKLDWFLTRGVKVNRTKIGKYISDHRSVFIKCSINKNPYF